MFSSKNASEQKSAKANTRVRDMTSGSIIKQVILFSLPLMLGNVFQMLYNTVDSVVVGNFVSKQALAAVGATTMIVNMQVFFFNGFSIGAGVVIARLFGGRREKELHDAIETAVAFTFVLCAIFTVIGIAGTEAMLRFMSTPDDVFGDARTYLRIYFSGVSGLLIYNMGSAILRAVGDTVRPLMFLVLTSVLNIILDLTFVLGFRAGIAGVAWATILSQFISAVLVLTLLTRTKEIYRLTWRDLRIDRRITANILAVGLPAGIQSAITAFSNTFVQAYVNHFGSDCMAGWSSYNKLEQFIMLPMQSMSMASTTFVSQNIGAGQKERAEKGAWTVILLAEGVTAVIVAVLIAAAPSAVMLFSKDSEVIRYGALFIRTNTLFLLFNCFNHVMAGALRGRGDARGPMIIMLACFVVVRQIYLFVFTRFVANIPVVVGFGYPVGWMACCFTEYIYYRIRYRRRLQ